MQVFTHNNNNNKLQVRVFMGRVELGSGSTYHLIWLHRVGGRNSLFTCSQIRFKKKKEKKKKKKPNIKEDLATQKSIGLYWIQLILSKGDDGHKLMVEIKNFKNQFQYQPLNQNF